MNGRFFEKYTGGDSFVEDENALEAVFTSLDETFGENYVVKMKYYQLYIKNGANPEEWYVINISKVKVGNLKNALDTLEKRKARFDGEDVYNATAKMLLYVFTQGRDTVAFLKEIKEQGGDVELYLRDNEKPRFSVYGNRFLIPAKTTFSEMFGIVGDINALIESGLLTGRKFGGQPTPLRYNFNVKKIYKLLKDDGVTMEQAEEILPLLFFSDMRAGKAVLLNSDDEILEITDINAEIKLRPERGEKIVILRDDYSKSEIADVLERLLTGENRGIISASLAKKVTPNFVIPLSDKRKIFEERPLPHIPAGDFDTLRSQIRADMNAMDFAADVSDTLLGYGGYCPLCDVRTSVIDCYAVKDFRVEIISAMDGMEKMFRFSLYMCMNDFYAADGWVIEDVIVGGMNPFMWLEEVTSANIITPEFLHCNVRMTTRYTETPPNPDGTVSCEVLATPQVIRDFILTPLMAAKWVEDNISADEEDV